MTRAERENVLHCLKVMIDEEVCEECNLYGTTGTDHCEADCVRMAIKLLEQEPTTKNDLGVDCISREQALKELKESAEHHANDSREEVLLRRDRDIIKALPSVTPQEPRKGHWKDIPKYKDIAWLCSECEHFTTMKHNYCPNCGAKMVEQQESDGKE